MKKFLLFAGIACASLSSFAQLADNQRPVGTYYSNVLPSAGVGNPEVTGKFTVFTSVPMSQFEKIGNAKIVGVRFGLNNSIGPSTIHIRPVIFGADKADIFDDVATETIETTGRGWNYVKLRTPIELSYFDGASALFLGYDYEQVKSEEKAYPIFVTDDENDYGFVYQGVMDGVEGFFDYSPTGSLCAQFICEGDIPDYDIIAGNILLDKTTMNIDAKSAVMLNLFNYGLKEARNVSLDVFIDGEKVQTLTQRTVSDTPKDYLFNNLLVPESVKPGVHTLTMKSTAVAGVPLEVNTDDDAAKVKFTAITEDCIVKRDKHLIEQFTSVDCTWCPRGTKLLGAICEKNPNATIIAFHGNMGAQDPYCIDQCYDYISKLGIYTFPAAAVNRITFDDGSYAFNLSQDEEDFDWAVGKFTEYIRDYSETCIAPIQAKAVLTEDGSSIRIVIEGAGSEHLRNVLSDCVLNVCVVENDLVSYQRDQNTVIPQYTHNNVFRYAPTKIDGDKLKFKEDNWYQNNYIIRLERGWNPKNLEVVAYVTRKTDYPFGCGVINATRVPVQSYTESIGILEADDASLQTPLYDLSGRVATPAAKGIFIQNGKKVLR